MRTNNYPTLYGVILATFLTGHSLGGQSLDILHDPQAVRQKMDSIIRLHQSEYQVTGTTYAIVRKDRILAINGIGLADIHADRPMDAEKTTFMLGSLSKLIVVTAVMQLVESGQLDLDEDIGSYVQGLEVPKATLRHLLTHTAGLEEKTFDRLRLEEDRFMSLEAYLQKEMPTQIFPAGSLAAYSNHGMALAGLIVEQASGQAFEDYVVQNIFQPLEMKSASFRLNQKSKSDLATPYLIRNGKPVDTHLEYVQTIPASMLIGSARDMAHFMMAHLNGGFFKHKSILREETMALLQKRHYSAHPDMDGRALGFFEKTFLGKKGLTHGNTRNGFISYIHLIPEDSLGIFVTINGGNQGFRTKVIYEFLKAIYPPATSESPNFMQPVDLKQYAGTYASTRRNATTIERIFHQVFLDRSITVTTRGDTALFVPNSVVKMEKPGLFSNLSGTVRISFSNENGALTLHLPGRSDAYQVIPWYGQRAFTIFALGTPVMTFIVIALVRLIRLFNRKRATLYRVDHRWWAFCASGLLFLISFFGSMVLIAENIQYGIPVYFYLIFLLPICSILLFIAAVGLTVYQWKELKTIARWRYGYMTIVGLLFLWQMYYWNFIGFEF